MAMTEDSFYSGFVWVELYLFTFTPQITLSRQKLHFNPCGFKFNMEFMLFCSVSVVFCWFEWFGFCCFSFLPPASGVLPAMVSTAVDYSWQYIKETPDMIMRQLHFVMRGLYPHIFLSSLNDFKILLAVIQGFWTELQIPGNVFAGIIIPLGFPYTSKCSGEGKQE